MWPNHPSPATRRMGRYDCNRDALADLLQRIRPRCHDVIMRSPRVATQGGAANSQSRCVAAWHDGQVMPNAVRRPGVKMMRNCPLHVGQRKLATASALPDIATDLTCSHAA